MIVMMVGYNAGDGRARGGSREGDKYFIFQQPICRNYQQPHYTAGRMAPLLV